MAANTTQVEIQTQVKTTTKITLVIGMITAGFVGLTLFSNAFLAGPISRNLPLADTNPPAVSLQTPLKTLVTGTKLLSISLMDYSDISQAQVFIDGQSRYIANEPASQWLFILSTTTLVSGPHTIAFSATDSAGNTTSTEPLSFIVAN